MSLRIESNQLVAGKVFSVTWTPGLPPPISLIAPMGIQWRAVSETEWGLWSTVSGKKLATMVKLDERWVPMLRGERYRPNRADTELRRAAMLLLCDLQDRQKEDEDNSDQPVL